MFLTAHSLLLTDITLSSTLLGMGMPPGGQINPMLMHDVGIFQGMGMHNDNNSIANHIFGERNRGGRAGGANGRVARF